MATEVADAYVALYAKMPGVQNDIAKGLGGPDAMRAVDDAGKKGGKGFTKAWGVAAVAGIAAVGIGAAVAGITNYLGESVEAAKEAETAQLQLQTAYDKFPAVASVSIDSLRALNNELMAKTRFDDDALASGQALLAQYGLTGEQLTELTPLLADYAARTGTDVTTAASQLGKAMLGQGRALKGVGIDFQDTGTVAGNFEQVMAGLTEKVGGFATTEGASAAGTAARMSNAFGELQETIGGALLPALVSFQNMFLDNVMPGLQLAATWIADRIGPAMDSLGEMFANLDAGGLLDLLAYLSPIGLLFKVLAPLLPVIADLLGQVFSIFGDAVASILPQLTPVLETIVTLLGGLAAQVLPMLTPILLLLADVFATVLEAVMPIIMALAEALVPILEALIPVVLTVLEAFMPLIEALIGALAPILTTIADIVAAVVVPILDTLVDVITWLAEVITWLVKNIVVPFFIGVLIPAVKQVGQIFEAVFGGLGDFFAGIWEGIVAAFKWFINTIIDGINGFIGGLNEVGNFLSDATGGAVDFNIGRIPRLAEGGVVSATPGGILANIGEGRYDEVVLPLSPEVLGQLGGGIRPGTQLVLLVDGREFRAYVDERADVVVTGESDRRKSTLTSGRRSGG